MDKEAIQHRLDEMAEDTPEFVGNFYGVSLHLFSKEELLAVIHFLTTSKENQDAEMDRRKQLFESLRRPH